MMSFFKKYFIKFKIHFRLNLRNANIFTFLIRNIRYVGIQNRLIVSFAIFSLIPLLITGLFAYYKSSEAIKTKISTYSIEVMNQAGENIQNEITKLENDSIDIVFSDHVQNTITLYNKMNEWEKQDAEWKLQNMLIKKFSFSRSVFDVLIYTENNEKIIAYGDVNVKFRLKAEYLANLFKESSAKNGVPYWTIQDKDNEEDGIAAYTPNRPIKAGILLSRSFKSLNQGIQVGYIIIRIDEKYISNIYKNINIGNGSDIFILNSQGIVISSRNPDVQIAKKYKDGSLINKIKSSREKEIFSFNSDISGKRSLIAYTYLPGADLYLVSTIPFSYLDYESKKIGIYIAILGIICFLLALLLSFVVSKSISKPLNRLVVSMNSVKAGNFVVQIEDTSGDELGKVTNNFNSMVKEIKYLIDEVKKRENLKRIAELKTLQAQINPHFLSNTLNAVRWLANLQKAENISSIVTSLIQLLHGCMGKGGELIKVRDEIEYVKNYLNIMGFRYYDKFKVHFEIEEEILDFQILKFVLQPIVENSLIHGLEPRDGQGIIAIKGYRVGNELNITVTDNGVGISKDTIDNLMQDRPQNKKGRLSGIGIGNVDERIKLYFGEEYGISIESVPNLFTTVEIKIPISDGGGKQ